MPILDLGYRRWSGERTPRPMRWGVVARTGIALIWRGAWLRRLLLIATFPAVFAVFGFFAYEQAVQGQAPPRLVATILSRQLRAPELADRLLEDPAAVRHDVWAQFLMWLFRYPQAVLMVVVLGIVAPRLISYDLRSRGYLLYLSRPLTPAEYLLGKTAVLWFLLAMITTVPALLVYVAGVLLSPGLVVVEHTWDLPLRVLLATCVLAIPTSSLAICYSSLTTESRFAGYAWFATWILGWVTYAIMTSSALVSGPRPRERWESGEIFSAWQFVSPYHTLGKLQAGVFGLVPDWTELVLPAICCAAVSVLSFVVSHRVISGTLRH